MSRSLYARQLPSPPFCTQPFLSHASPLSSLHHISCRENLQRLHRESPLPFFPLSYPSAALAFLSWQATCPHGWRGTRDRATFSSLALVHSCVHFFFLCPLFCSPVPCSSIRLSATTFQVLQCLSTCPFSRLSERGAEVSAVFVNNPTCSQISSLLYLQALLSPY